MINEIKQSRKLRYNSIHSSHIASKAVSSWEYIAKRHCNHCRKRLCCWNHGYGCTNSCGNTSHNCQSKTHNIHTEQSLWNEKLTKTTLKYEGRIQTATVLWNQNMLTMCNYLAAIIATTNYDCCILSWINYSVWNSMQLFIDDCCNTNCNRLLQHSALGCSYPQHCVLGVQLSTALCISYIKDALTLQILRKKYTKIFLTTQADNPL